MRLLLILLLAGSTLAALNDDCVLNTTPDPCTASVDNSECAPKKDNPSQGVCQCKSRFSPDGAAAACIAALALDSISCGADDWGVACHSIPYALCAAPAEGSTDATKCSCYGDYIPSSDGTVCLLKTFSDRCVEDAQCATFDLDGETENKAKCQTERCICPQGFVQDLINFKCTRVLNLDNDCTVDEQCPENSICKEIALPPGNKCKCADFYVDNGALLGPSKKCLPEAFIVGDVCEADAQCYRLDLEGATGKATCTANKCVCPENHVTSNDETSCLPSVLEAEIGEKNCIQDVQCPENYKCDWPNCVSIKLP